MRARARAATKTAAVLHGMEESGSSPKPPKTAAPVTAPKTREELAAERSAQNANMSAREQKEIAERIDALREAAARERAELEAEGRAQIALVADWARRGGTAVNIALAAARGWFDGVDSDAANAVASAMVEQLRPLRIDAGARLLDVGMGAALHALLLRVEELAAADGLKHIEEARLEKHRRELRTLEKQQQALIEAEVAPKLLRDRASEAYERVAPELRHALREADAAEKKAAELAVQLTPQREAAEKSGDPIEVDKAADMAQVLVDRQEMARDLRKRADELQVEADGYRAERGAAAQQCAAALGQAAALAAQRHARQLEIESEWQDGGETGQVCAIAIDADAARAVLREAVMKAAAKAHGARLEVQRQRLQQQERQALGKLRPKLARELVVQASMS